MRQGRAERKTAETSIACSINLDGGGTADINTPVPFLTHMLEQLARHGSFDLIITATGDTHIDDHHTVEDIGITIGIAFADAIGNKSGIARFGSAYAPLDEALSRVVVDISGRPGVSQRIPFRRARIGNFDVDLLSEFFHGFCNHAKVTLHIDNLFGDNAHHQAESVFKAFALALRAAVRIDQQHPDVPSTKGVL